MSSAKRLTEEGHRKKLFDPRTVTLQKKCNELEVLCQAKVALLVQGFGEEVPFAYYRSRPDFPGPNTISNHRLCKTPNHFISKEQHLRDRARKSKQNTRQSSIESTSDEEDSFKSFRSSSDEQEELIEAPLRVIIPPIGGKIKPLEQNPSRIPSTLKGHLVLPSSPASPAPSFKLRPRRRLSSSSPRSPYQLRSPQLFRRSRNGGILSPSFPSASSPLRGLLERTLSPRIEKHPRSPLSTIERRVTRSHFASQEGDNER